MSAVNITARMKHARVVEREKLKIDQDADGDVKPPRTEDVKTVLEAFQATQTPIQLSKCGPVRLGLEGGNGERWHVDVCGSTVTVNSSDSGPSLTAIYNSRSSVLTLFYGYHTRKWMQAFPGTTPLSALSIPGTHNSPTCYQALPSVRCQVAPITTQLNEGIRYLDVRVQLHEVSKGARSSAMSLAHSVFPISFSGPKLFATLIDSVYAFLRENPSEMVIMSLKREGRGSGTDGLFAKRLKAHYTGSPFWHTAPGIPTLGEVRGKIVILRRFQCPEPFGIDATDWADNALNYHYGDIHIQDFYSVTSSRNIAKKIKAVTEHLERAAGVVHDTVGLSASDGLPRRDGHPLVINHLSANNFWTPGYWPDKVAAKLNPAVLHFLCEGHASLRGDRRGDGGLGIVVCDWVGADGDWDLVRAIIGTNARSKSNASGNA